MDGRKRRRKCVPANGSGMKVASRQLQYGGYLKRVTATDVYYELVGLDAGIRCTILFAWEIVLLVLWQ